MPCRHGSGQGRAGIEGCTKALHITQFREMDVMDTTRGSEGHPALTDVQTGLPNRLHFTTVFEVIFAAGSRGVPVTLLLLEIDGFSEWAGTTETSEVERVLQSVGDALSHLLRQTDLFARTEESCFSICLLDCNIAGAVLVADRIDGALDSLRRGTELGFSMGGAAFDVQMKRPDELLEAAEKALRSAQGKGTNQMEFSR